MGDWPRLGQVLGDLVCCLSRRLRDYSVSLCALWVSVSPGGVRYCSAPLPALERLGVPRGSESRDDALLGDFSFCLGKLEICREEKGPELIQKDVAKQVCSETCVGLSSAGLPPAITDPGANFGGEWVGLLTCVARHQCWWTVGCETKYCLSSRIPLQEGFRGPF